MFIRGRCLFKSLLYECDVKLMHYGLRHSNGEPTIIRRVLGDILQNNSYCNLDEKSENVN